MVSIFDKITNALDNHEQFTIDKKGVLHLEGKVIKFVRKIFGWESGWIINVSNYCTKLLDEMERNPSADDHLETFQAVKAKLGKYKTKEAEANRVWVDLSVRMEALQERLNSPITNKPSRDDDLVEAAQEWKNNYDLYEEKDLTEKELAKLDQLANYPGYAQLVINGDKKFKDECFKWILRDNNSVEAYVKFPSMCKKLKACLLAGRIGRFAETSLKVEGNNLTLPFEVEDETGTIKSERISILDGKRVVHLRGGYSPTIDTIFNIFKNKNDDPGKVEYFGKNGISNYSTRELGWWDELIQDYVTVDLENDKWWEELPVYETLSKLEVRKRFNLEKLEDNQWVAVVRSTAESLEMDIDRSHGYLGIAVPQGNDQWRIYDFGKYAERFPTKLVDKLFMLANTVRAKIFYFDENDVYSHRIQAKAPFILSEEQGLDLMKEIKEDIIKAREGNIVFQFGWENCAYWPQEKLKKVLGEEECPNFFRSSGVEATPKMQPLKSIFNFIRNLSQKVQRVAFHIIELLLMGWRGVHIVENGKKVHKCLSTSGFHHTGEMFHPGYLHKQIRDEKSHGVLTFGNINTEFEVN